MDKHRQKCKDKRRKYKDKSKNVKINKDKKIEINIDKEDKRRKVCEREREWRKRERERGLLTISFIRSHVWCNYLFPRSGPIELPHRQLFRWFSRHCCCCCCHCLQILFKMVTHCLDKYTYFSSMYWCSSYYHNWLSFDHCALLWYLNAPFPATFSSIKCIVKFLREIAWGVIATLMR